MEEQTSPGNFENSVLPHLDAAYNLAHWLTRNGQDAEDAVQEAFARASACWSKVRDFDVPEQWVRRVAINLAPLGSCMGLRCLIHTEVPGLHTHPGWLRGWR